MDDERAAGIEQYRTKRDFSRTPEPPPQHSERDQGPLVFVVQKHAARRLHFDFRLEVDGVLKSWAIPNGPSRDPKVKRLAVMVEDHPLEYGSFEGAIPPGEYGAGQVIVWDRGTYSPEEKGTLFFENREEAEAKMRRGLAEGKISFYLRGSRLKGSWALVRMAGRGEDNWLLIKHQDDFARTGEDSPDEDTSVVSGLGIEDLKAGNVPGTANPKTVDLAGLEGARHAGFPERIAPMLAMLVETPGSGPGWVVEPKLDGYRNLACIRQGRVKLWSRRGLDATGNYPHIVEHLSEQPVSEMVLDGEIIALDEEGVPNFELLQRSAGIGATGNEEVSAAIVYYVFDLLYLDGYDLTRVKLQQRREVLEEVLAPTERVRLVEQFTGDANRIFETFRQFGLEGIVVKRQNSIYEGGRRSKNWTKVKSTLSDDFVVGGFTHGLGGRAHTFGALLLGYYDDAGRLRYAGSVGSGFHEQALVDLRRRLDEISTGDAPFEPIPPLPGGKTWVRPEIVVEVKFNQWTRAGYLRAPVFLRLRDDKPASDTRRSASSIIGSSKMESEDEEGLNVGNNEVASVLEQLAAGKQGFLLEVEGYQISLSNLDKELWPAKDGPRPLTKRDLLVYLARTSGYFLDHLRDRPLTLTRYPDGIGGEHFYQKHWNYEVPEFVKTVGIYSESKAEFRDYLVCNNLATLLWLGQIANLEFHTWYSRITPGADVDRVLGPNAGANDILNYPDFIVFDLDPYIYSGEESKGDEPQLNRLAYARTCEVARWLREILDSLSMSSFVKTSGRTGLHIYVPIIRRFDFDAVRSIAENIGRTLVGRHPQEITMEWSVKKRTGKIFFDHNQNVRGKTLASVYSPRPSPDGTVSMPVRWEELDRVYPTRFTLLTVPARLDEAGDLWKRILDFGCNLERLAEVGSPLIRGAG